MVVTLVLIPVIVGVISTWPQPVLGHARLYDPPGRSTMWRFGYNTPINYQDNELYCGGFWHQMNLGYKCGLCGDPYDGKRENEAGGKYATGIITRTYTQGQEVNFQVDVTANHRGYFEFKICPTNNPRVKETQECFDRYPLTLAKGSGTRNYISTRSEIMSVKLRLPRNLVCDFCVLQLRYHAGNSWGTDPDGRSCVGCGPQEEFYGCADIKIVPANSNHPSVHQFPNTNNNTGENAVSPSVSSTEVGNSSNAGRDRQNIQDRVEIPVAREQESSYTKTDRISISGSTPSRVANEQGGSGDRSRGNQSSVPLGTSGENMICHGTNGQPGLDQWCQLNCQLGFCPATHCLCVRGQYVHNVERPKGCRGAGAAAPVYDSWCKANCAAGNCPTSICVC